MQPPARSSTSGSSSTSARGWVDAGVAATRVHDVPRRQGLRRRAGSSLRPRRRASCSRPLRKFCASPVLPRVRAILSWQHEPTAGDPDYVPVWGEVQEDHIQIRPRRRFFPVDILDVLEPVVQDRPGDRSRSSSTSTCCRSRSPSRTRSVRSRSTRSRCRRGPGPTRCRSPLERLSRIYSPDKLKVLASGPSTTEIARLALEEVPAHRFAAAEVIAGALRRARTGMRWPRRRSRSTQLGHRLDVSWSACSTRARATRPTRSWSASGSTTTPASSWRPTASSARPGSPVRPAAQARRSTSRSGPTSTTTAARRTWAPSRCAHDYITMPAGGLSYAAVLPAGPRRLPAAVHRAGDAPGPGGAVVEHAAVDHRSRRWCRTGATGSTPTSTCIPAGRYDGVARLTIVGGVDTDEIDPATGVTLPGCPHRLQRRGAGQPRLPVRRPGDGARPERPGAGRDDVPAARPQRHGRRLVDPGARTRSSPRR